MKTKRQIKDEIMNVVLDIATSIKKENTSEVINHRLKLSNLIDEALKSKQTINE